MAPSHSRQLLAWTLPTIAVLLSYLWYKRKRIGAKSDPGDTKTVSTTTTATDSDPLHVKSLAEELEEAELLSSANSTPSKLFNRSLSGVDSAPIDIVIPPELRSVKSNPVVISDEDLDFEIEKIKSMKNSVQTATTKKSGSNGASPEAKSLTPSPINKENSTPIKSAKKKNRAAMAQNEVPVVEETLTSLKLTTIKETPKKVVHKKEHEELQRQSSDRDSANHSPADIMLASPSLSSISDNHSEGSSDSGKGGSDVATPPPGIESSVTRDINAPTVYEFAVPQLLVGKLIGRQGSFVSQIKSKTKAKIVVKKHPHNNKLKVCTVDGTQQEIDKALKMIRDKFPVKTFPELTMEQLNLQQVPIALLPDHLYLKLVEGINNDTIVSCMVAPNYLFVQLPTHPSFPSLNFLTTCMNLCYQDVNSPLLPTPISESTICAAYSVDGWYRAMILTTDVENETSYVKFLDYGGFGVVENSKLKQIRGDFMLLPFQAAECMLANVKSLREDGTWPQEAFNLVADLTKGAILYTQVADYTEDGIPLVLCYIVLGPQQVIFLNQQLVDSGFAEWVPFEDEPIADSLEGAVGGAVA